eukprot:108007-Chlamydomonas_euryale.AAC.1
MQRSIQRATCPPGQSTAPQLAQPPNSWIAHPCSQPSCHAAAVAALVNMQGGNASTHTASGSHSPSSHTTSQPFETRISTCSCLVAPPL